MEEKEYEVTIKEVLERKVRCRAASEEEAKNKVIADYRKSNIVLLADDFSYNDFSSREIVPEKKKVR